MFSVMLAFTPHPETRTSIHRHKYRAAVCLFACIILFYKLVSYDSPTVTQLLVPIPPKIWQIYFPFGSSPLDVPDNLIQTWPAVNQDYEYTLMSEEGANRFVQEHFSSHPEVIDAYVNLRTPILRVDFLRYLILASQGGVYSDTDTAALKPIKEWIPVGLEGTIHAVIGIEYDQGNDKPYYGMSVPLQFCQWTIAASAGHPILNTVITMVVEALKKARTKHQISVGEHDPTDEEVMTLTGPVIWTEAVFKVLSETMKTTIDARNVTGLKEPKLFGDVLILPINAFGSGQEHSNSWRGDGNPPDALVRHSWKGSWKHSWR